MFRSTCLLFSLVSLTLGLRGVVKQGHHLLSQSPPSTDRAYPEQLHSQVNRESVTHLLTIVFIRCLTILTPLTPTNGIRDSGPTGITMMEMVWHSSSSVVRQRLVQAGSTMVPGMSGPRCMVLPCLYWSTGDT